MNKYHAKKATRKLGKDNYTFDSKAEAAYFDILVQQLRTGKIQDFSVQPCFVIAKGFKVFTDKTKSGVSTVSDMKYTPDFRVFGLNGEQICVEVKGFSDTAYNLRKRLFLSQLDKHGIDEYHLVFKDRVEKFFRGVV